MSKTLTASDRSALIRLASDLPAGSPERRAVLTGLAEERLLRFGSGGIEMKVQTWVEDESSGQEIDREDRSQTFGTIREAMDWVENWTRRWGPDKKGWSYNSSDRRIEQSTDQPDGVLTHERIFQVELEWRGKPFPKKALLKALNYLRTGRTSNDPVLMGDTLTVPGSRGDIVITPGHPKPWRQWTVTRNGKPAHVNQGDTEDASDYHRKGFDPTDAAEASGITQIFDKETAMSSSAVQKLWSHLYRGSFRGLRL